MMAFVSNLRQVGSFLRVLRFPPPIKLDYHKMLKVVFDACPITQTNLFTDKGAVIAL